MEQPSFNGLLSLALILLLVSCDLWNSQDKNPDQEYTSLLCVRKDGKFGFINEWGEEVIPCKYDQPSSFHEGWAALKKGDNWAYYDVRGHKVLDLGDRFTYCGQFHEGMALVSTTPLKDMLDIFQEFWDDLCPQLQFINKKGEVVLNVDNQWDVLCSYVDKIGFSDGLLKVVTETSEGKLSGFLNNKGELVMPFNNRHQRITQDLFSEGLVVAGKKIYDSTFQKSTVVHGYKDTSDNWVIPPIYAKALPFKYGAAVVWEQNPKRELSYWTYLIDKKGNRIFPSDIHTNERYVRDSLLAVFKPRLNEDRVEVFSSYGKSRRYALAKVDGTILSDFIYESLMPGKSDECLWIASLPDKKAYGALDDSLNLIFPFQFPSIANSFEDGLAVVYLTEDGKAKGVINSKGELVPLPDSSLNYQISGEIIYPNETGGFNYINRHGQPINLEGYEKAGIFQRLPLPDR